MLAEAIQQMLPHYNEGIKLYRHRKWDEAIAKFEQALEARPDDGPSKLYIDRCQHFKEVPPPDDWDGTFAYQTK